MTQPKMNTSLLMSVYCLFGFFFLPEMLSVLQFQQSPPQTRRQPRRDPSPLSQRRTSPALPRHVRLAPLCSRISAAQHREPLRISGQTAVASGQKSPAGLRDASAATGFLLCPGRFGLSHRGAFAFFLRCVAPWSTSVSFRGLQAR